jgi:hypothetical protein
MMRSHPQIGGEEHANYFSIPGYFALINAAELEGAIGVPVPLNLQ